MVGFKRGYYFKRNVESNIGSRVSQLPSEQNVSHIKVMSTILTVSFTCLLNIGAFLYLKN